MLTCWVFPPHILFERFPETDFDTRCLLCDPHVAMYTGRVLLFWHTLRNCFGIRTCCMLSHITRLAPTDCQLTANALAGKLPPGWTRRFRRVPCVWTVTLGCCAATGSWRADYCLPVPTKSMRQWDNFECRYRGCFISVANSRGASQFDR